MSGTPSTRRTANISDSEHVDADDQLLEAQLALLELFAVVDDVFTEPDAFERQRPSLGRIYRQWKKSRAALDPDFDPNRYQFNQAAAGEQTSSTGQKSIFGKRSTAQTEKRRAKSSVRRARSSNRASNSPS